ncbi:MAG: hypothetical protein AMXMBFR57_07140 [Acidimicrobiia bacterium]
MSRSWRYLLGAGLVVIAIFFWFRDRQAPVAQALRVGIAPYQDLAMLVNAEPQGFAKANGVDIALTTLAWEEIVPAVASAGRTIDVGFGSLIEFLTKYDTLNRDSADPVVFFQPLYVYKGGGFVALKPEVPVLDRTSLADSARVKQFLSLRLGAQRQSLYEMMIHILASRVGVDSSTLRLTDLPMNDSLLALESGSLDAASAGLTQLNEASRRGGRLVLAMEDLGVADITGFIARRSTIDARRADLEGLVRAWFSSVDYVMQDLDVNSASSIDYLRRQASTQYSLEEYKAALSQEFLPRSLAELEAGILAPGAQFDFDRLVQEINEYLVATGRVTTPAPAPLPLLPGAK